MIVLLSESDAKTEFSTTFRKSRHDGFVKYLKNPFYETIKCNPCIKNILT